MKAEVQAKLREPFKADEIGKLPRLTCGACRDSKGKACGTHPKGRCVGCNNWISPAHIHLDYVGHADVTDRLLQADPEWTWEPLAFGQDGLPLLDGNGGLWIRMTVCGTTRIGYGDAEGKRGTSAMKETIGDAIRNASMRFGVALDLWRKEPHHDDDEPAKPRKRSDEPKPDVTPEQATKFKNLLGNIKATKTEAGFATATEAVKTALKAKELTAAQANELMKTIGGMREHLQVESQPEITAKTRGRLFALLGEQGMDESQARRGYASSVLGRDIETMSVVTEPEAQVLIADLEKRKREAVPA